MELIDAEVLATLQDDVLRPRTIDEALSLALEELSPANARRQRDRLEADLAHVEKEAQRLADAIGRGGPLDALVERLRVLANTAGSPACPDRRRASRRDQPFRLGAPAPHES